MTNQPVTPTPSREAVAKERADWLLDGPSGFDPSRIAEAVTRVEGSLLQPIIRKAADEFYVAVLDTTEDYLRENLDWNLSAHLKMLERENQRMRTELYEVDRYLGGDTGGHAGRIETLKKLDRLAALAIEAAAAGETERLDPKGESPVAESDAPETPSSTTPRKDAR